LVALAVGSTTAMLVWWAVEDGHVTFFAFARLLPPPHQFAAPVSNFVRVFSGFTFPQRDILSLLLTQAAWRRGPCRHVQAE